MMNPNLLDMAKGYLDSDTIRKASAHVGENPERTQSALNAAIPTVMAGFVRQASSDPSGGTVARTLSEARQGEAPEDLPSRFAGGAKTDALIAKSQGILGGMFGDRLPAAVDHVATTSGVSRGAAGSILAMAAPLVMGVLGREATSRKLGPAGISSMLIGQKGAVASALGGAGMSSIFGGADWTKPVGAAGEHIGAVERIPTGERTGETRHYERTPEGKPAGRRIGLPLILLGALAILAVLMLLRRGGPRVSTPEMPRAPQMEAPRVQAPAAPPAPTVQQPAPPEAPAAPTMGQAPTTPPPAIGGGPSASAAELNQFFADKNAATPKQVPLDGINFDPGSSQLSAGQVASLDPIAKALSDHPTSKVRVDAFTDDQGDSNYNQKLSADRANAVRDALIRKGVNPNQLSIAGKGASGALASNDTDEGRATNRRVELVIIAR